MLYSALLTTSKPRYILNINTMSFSKVLTLCTLLLALVFQTIEAHANDTEDLTTVYKVIAEDGSVSFSDQPKAEAETLMVPPVTTVPAISPSTDKTLYPAEKKASKVYQRYHTLSILAPADNSAFYSGSGEIDVLLDIKPALLDGDQVQIFLDGALVQSNNQIQARLQAVSRGAHELLVKLVSDSGKVHKQASSTFTVHRPSIRN